MVMKFVAVVIAALLMACAKTPPAKVALASADDCNSVYSRWLSIGAVSEIGADPSSEIEMKAAVDLLDKDKRSDGAADRFFNSCITTMNTDQAACMLHAITFDELHQCAKMYATK